MVGGLVQDQHVRRVDQGRRQGHPLPLAAGESAYLLGEVRDAQTVQHGLGLVLVQGPERGGEVEEHLLQHRGVLVHHRVLGQQADLDVGVPGDGAPVRLRDAGEHLQKGGLAGAVDADDAHLVPLVEVEAHVVQQLAAAEVDGEMFRG